MNKVFLIGNLTKDPELTTTGNNIKLCRFTIAVSRSYAKDGNNDTDYIPVVVWRAQAENCANFLKKGSKAAISGSIQTRQYEGKDGTRRYTTEIVADEIQFLSTKSSDNGTGADDFDTLEPIDDELPF